MDASAAADAIIEALDRVDEESLSRFADHPARREVRHEIIRAVLDSDGPMPLSWKQLRELVEQRRAEGTVAWDFNAAFRFPCLLAELVLEIPFPLRLPAANSRPADRTAAV